MTIGGGGGGGGGSKGFRSRQDSKYGIADDDAPAFATPSRSRMVSVDISHNRGGSSSGSTDEIPLTGISKETYVTWVVEPRSASPDPHRGSRM